MVMEQDPWDGDLELELEGSEGIEVGDAMEVLRAFPIDPFPEDAGVPGRLRRKRKRSFSNGGRSG